MKSTDSFDRERFVCKVAACVYALAVLGQEESSFHVYLDDIERYFSADFFPKGWRKDISLLKDIQDEILTYKGCDNNADACWLDINGYDEYGDPCEKDKERDESDDAFNMCLWTNYIANEYDAEEYD